MLKKVPTGEDREGGGNNRRALVCPAKSVAATEVWILLNEKVKLKKVIISLGVFIYRKESYLSRFELVNYYLRFIRQSMCSPWCAKYRVCSGSRQSGP